MDDITLVRSMTTDSVDHEAALRMIHSGKIFPGRPAWGSWVLYGLGTERQDLPAYVVLSDPGGLPVDGRTTGRRGFLPAVYQGTPFRATGTPVANLAHARRRAARGAAQPARSPQRPEPAASAAAPGNAELEGPHSATTNWRRRCRPPCPTCSTSRTRPRRRSKLYGLDNPKTAEYGKRCLLARRLVERGVRFVQIFLSGQPWDTHSKNAESLKSLCAMTDQPSAARARPEAPRPARLDHRDVDGRVRPAADLAGTGRPRPQPPRVLALAGRRRLQGATSTAPPTTSATVPSRTSSASPTCTPRCSTPSASTTRLTFPHEGRDDSLTDAVVTHAEVVQELLD